MSLDLHNAGPLIAEVRRLREEVAALKAEASLRDIAAVGVDKVNADIVAALKAEVASLSARFEEACADATRAEADRDAWHNIANKHEAEVARLAGLAREACDLAFSFAEDAREYGADMERIASLRAAIPTPDPAAVSEVTRLRLALRDAVMLIRTVRAQSPDDTFGSTKHTAPWIPGTAYLANAVAMLLDRIEPIAEGATPDPAAFVARPLADYHEDDGNVLWWKFPINEPPYVGSTLDDDWPGYHTHWTPLPPCPVDPALGGVR